MSNETMTDARALADSLDQIAGAVYGGYTKRALPQDVRDTLRGAAARLRGESAPEGQAVVWPSRMVNLPCPDGSHDRIVGFRVSDGDPILGSYGLSEPLAWLRSVTVDRQPAAPAPVAGDAVAYACKGPTGIHFVDQDRDECVTESRRDGSRVVELIERPHGAALAQDRASQEVSREGQG